MNFKSVANFSMEENGKTNKRFHYMKSPLPSFRFPSSTACLATTTTSIPSATSSALLPSEEVANAEQRGELESRTHKAGAAAQKTTLILPHVCSGPNSDGALLSSIFALGCWRWTWYTDLYVYTSSSVMAHSRGVEKGAKSQ